MALGCFGRFNVLGYGVATFKGVEFEASSRVQGVGLLFALWFVIEGNIGALITGIGCWGHYTIIIVRNPRNPILII